MAFLSNLLDQLGFGGKPAVLPTAPAERSNVVLAVGVLAAAERAQEAAATALVQAEQKLADYRAGAAERLLATLGDAATTWLDGGAEGELPQPAGAKADGQETTLANATAEAQRRLATAQQAVALAKGRHTAALAQAKADFTAEIQPLVRAGMEEVRKQLGHIVALNDALRGLADHGFKNGADLPSHPNELAYPIPTGRRLAEIDERRAGLFAAPAAMPANLVLVRWLVDAMPYGKAEVSGIPLDDAAVAVKSLLAEPVDADDHKRLGTRKIVRLDGPTKVRITKPFTPRYGAVANPGTVLLLDGPTASRCINLGYGEAA